MSEWRVVALREALADVVGGGTPARNVPSFWGGDIPWASVKDMSPRSAIISNTEERITRTGLMASAANLVAQGTPVIATRMAVGRVALAGREIAINQDLKALVPATHTHPKYLFYCLQRLQPEVESVATGSTVKGVGVEDVLALEIGLPDKGEQRRIAEVLTAADERIQIAERLIAKLRDVKSGLVQDSFADYFKWPVVSLADISEMITSGSRGWAAYYADSGPLFIRIGNLTRRHVNLRLDDVVHVNPPSTSEVARTSLRKDDILISITADLGIIGVVPADLGEAYVNQHIATVRLSKKSAQFSRWVAHFLTSHHAQIYIQSINDAGAKAGLNLPSVGGIPVPIPPSDFAERVVGAIDAVDARISDEEKKRVKLVALKAGLMEDLLTGRRRIKSAG